MGTTLATLSPPAGARHRRKRKGRGFGSGNGRTAGRGYKGQGARSGVVGMQGFEGGQMPLQRRLPKRGFKNPFRVEFYAVNIDRLAGFDAGTVVDLEALKSVGLVPRTIKHVKILGNGELGIGLTVKAQAFSAAARTKIEAAGGSFEVVEAPKRAPSAQAKTTES